MTAPLKAIKRLRRAIDVIDDEMHDLLMRRVEIVERIGVLKDAAPGGLYIRPEREAQILRRLVSRHSGRFPAAVVARTTPGWRSRANIAHNQSGNQHTARASWLPL